DSTGIYTLVHVEVGNSNSNGTTATDLTRPTFFAKIFGVNQYATVATATAIHQPRDISLVLDYSASMQYASVLGDYPSGSGTFVSNNPEVVYPQFGHYSQTVGQTSDQNPKALPRFIGITRSTLEREAPCNYTQEVLPLSTSTAPHQTNGPPVVKDFY